MELAIVEPPVRVEELPPVKRALGYEVRVLLAPAPLGDADRPPSPPMGEDDRGRRRRRRRQAPGSPEQHHCSSTGGSAARDAIPRVPVHARLGPTVVDDDVGGPEAVEGDGSLFPTTEASQEPTGMNTSGVMRAIDDLAGEVIKPHLGNLEDIPGRLAEEIWPVDTAVGQDTAGVDLSLTPGVGAKESALSPRTCLSMVSPTMECFEGFDKAASAAEDWVPAQRSSHANEKLADASQSRTYDGPAHTPPGPPGDKQKDDHLGPEMSQALASPIPEFDQLRSPVLLHTSCRGSGASEILNVYTRRRYTRLHQPAGMLCRSAEVAALAEDRPFEARIEDVVAPAPSSIHQHMAKDVVVSTPSLVEEDTLPSPTHECPAEDVAALAPSLAEAADGQSVEAQIEEATTQTDAPVGVVGPCVPPPTEQCPAINREEFMTRLTRHTTSLLLATKQKRRTKTVPQGQTPRRSRRIAGAPAEFQPGEMERRSKKRVMRSLVIVGAQDAIDQQAQDEYARLFLQPLSDKHIQALAALFKWNIPAEFSQQGEDIVVA